MKNLFSLKIARVLFLFSFTLLFFSYNTSNVSAANAGTIWLYPPTYSYYDCTHLYPNYPPTSGFSWNSTPQTPVSYYTYSSGITSQYPSYSYSVQSGSFGFNYPTKLTDSTSGSHINYSTPSGYTIMDLANQNTNCGDSGCPTNTPYYASCLFMSAPNTFTGPLSTTAASWSGDGKSYAFFRVITDKDVYYVGDTVSIYAEARVPTSAPNVAVGIYANSPTGSTLANCSASTWCTASKTFIATTPGNYVINTGGCWYTGNQCSYSSFSITILPKITGYFDAATCDNLAGWAYNHSAPTTPLYVSVFQDGPNPTGKYVGTYLANNYRADVASALGTNGYQGFLITTPTSMKDGLAHSVYVYAKDPDTSLGTLLGTKSLTCPTTINLQFSSLIQKLKKLI